MAVSFLQLALVAAALAASLALFLSLKHEMRAQTRKHRAQMQELFDRMENSKGPEPREPEPEPVYAPTFPRSGFNLNKRIQVMRLLRRGEDVAHIAEALGVPRCEVELLIRVQRILATRAPALPRS